MTNRLVIICTLLFSSTVIVAQSAKPVDYLTILRRAAKYNSKDNRRIPAFIYPSSNDSSLVALRQKYKLDYVAGFGNEVSRLINIMHWVHNIVPHDGTVDHGIKNINADSIIEFVKKNDVGVACGHLATVLNDCYLAMGWKARKVFCFPKDSLANDPDSHVINIVYCATKGKWLWMDPTNDAYVMDENGELLSIEEVRNRLILKQKLLINPDANWNHRASRTYTDYLAIYMAKNLYLIYSPLNATFDNETMNRQDSIAYIHLLPNDYHKKYPLRTEKIGQNGQTKMIHYHTYNAKWFWQKPEDD
jgi:Transglutaminase-like superfamily